MLHTSEPAYGHEKTMKLGFVPEKTKRNLLFKIYNPKRGDRGSSYLIVLGNYQKPSNLAYFGVYCRFSKMSPLFCLRRSSTNQFLEAFI